MIKEVLILGSVVIFERGFVECYYDTTIESPRRALMKIASLVSKADFPSPFQSCVSLFVC